jgi:V-type H+-transporting ATPase subunit E
MAGALKEEDVQKQLKQMVSFILKEANEKAEEIKVKAEEEFNIERQRLIQAEKIKIIRDYERKEKQVETQKKISYSNELNQARLRTLKAREDVVHKIIHDAHKRLVSVSQSPQYKDLLCDLVVQAAIKLNEPSANVLCRDVDQNLVSSVLGKASQTYKQLTGRDIKLSIDQVNKLPPPPVEGSDQPSCCGGIVLSTNEGKIICNNTLEQRLTTAHEQLLPTMRTKLFGLSQSRKFFS